MNDDDFTTLIAKLAFTTSDYGGQTLYSLTKPSYQSYVLKEYVYLKSYVAMLLCVYSDVDTEKGKSLAKTMVRKLDKAFRSDIAGYGNTTDEMVERFNYYGDKVNQETLYGIGIAFAGLINSAAYINSKDGFSKFVNVAENVPNYFTNEMRSAQFKQNQKTSSCYVATATYQDAYHPNVVLLREFRDKRLQKSLPGRMFIKFYYTVGPYAAYLPEHFPIVRKLSKTIIDFICTKLAK